MSIFLLENISKVFKTHNGDFFALKNINLIFNSVGLVSIVGKSGSGKTTLLNILLGIEKPTSGKLFFCGKKINKMSDRAFSKYHLSGVSMIFQHYNVFPELTARENIALPLLIKGKRKVKALGEADKYLEKFSLSYLANQKVKTLSGGEKQRIAILRAIITKPKAILCDEPTGALDSSNSKKIMEILKELSKTILVINVSHDQKIVNEYSDRIITLKDGMICNDEAINVCSDCLIEKQKASYSSNWSILFTKVNFKLNIRKNIFSILSCSIGFASIFLSFGFYSGSQISQENALRNNLAVLHASASEKTYFEIDNSPLSYEKSIRPSSASLDMYLSDFENTICEPNLTYLFPAYPFGKYNEQTIENFQMVPIYDISLETYGKDLVVSGEPPNSLISEVVVNEEFVKLLNLNNNDAVDDLFNISYSTVVSYSTGEFDNPVIRDNYSFDYDLRIAAVIKEFSFLNTPKIYYSYPALKKELNAMYLENISEYLGEPITYLQFIEDADDDDQIGSYSYELFINSQNDINKLFNKIKFLSESKTTFQIESSAFDIQQSYKTFIESFSTALFVFVIIAFVGVNFILGMISLSTYIENKKNSAILTCLGVRNSSIRSIFMNENYTIVFVSITLSIFLAIVLQNVLNTLINKQFALDNLITIPFKYFLGYPFALPILLTVVALIFSTIFTLVPMFIYRHKSLSDELRDE